MDQESRTRRRSRGATRGRRGSQPRISAMFENETSHGWHGVSQRDAAATASCRCPVWRASNLPKQMG
jgi:hypothetical protein